MGADGFELLKNSVSRGFPTVMLTVTANALTPEALKKAIKLGAVSFLTKEKMLELESYLADAFLGGGKTVWKKFSVRWENFLANALVRTGKKES
jgi:hypothetical protein